ncbi:MAG: biotin/lipoyl-binding protein [Calditrichia bacterium]
MKEYKITVNGNTYNIQIKKLQTDTAIVEVDGQEYEVGVERKLKRHTGPLDVKPIKQVVSTPAPSATPAAAPTGTGKEVVAPLPGLITAVLVKEGDSVKAGQTVIKMEAMKMENEINADKTGTVKKIFVKEGESVLEGAPLIEIGG